MRPLVAKGEALNVFSVHHSLEKTRALRPLVGLHGDNFIL